MANLTLGLLGPLQITLAGSPGRSFESDKARALPAYLAIRADRPQRRESLAGLFWQHLPRQSARQNLRQTRYSVRRSIRDRLADPLSLLVDRERLQFNHSAATTLARSRAGRSVALAHDRPRVTSRPIGCFINQIALGKEAPRTKRDV